MWQIEFFFRAKRNYDFQNSIKRTSTEIIFVERGSKNRHDLSKYNRGTTLFSCMRVRRQAASINLNKHHYIKAAPRNSKSIFRKLWTRFNKIDPTIPPSIGETWRRHCRINYTRYYLRILSWISISYLNVQRVVSTYIVNFQLTIYYQNVVQLNEKLNRNC